VGISSADAGLNDHSFATAELIEVKFWLFAETAGGPSLTGAERSATDGANRQDDLRWRRYFLSLSPAALADRLGRTLEPGDECLHPAGSRSGVN
jgi:hypothetical protein